MAYIYAITNQLNGKQYVGKTNGTIQKRFQQHIKDSKRHKYEKRPLYDAMNKYGTDFFFIRQLEECSEKDASDREIYWIDRLDTYRNGYNASLGGEGLMLYDYEEIVRKYLELGSQKETAKFFGCDVSIVRNACVNHNVSIHCSSDVIKEKLGKPVKMIDKNNNQVICKFSSMREAASYLIKNNLSCCKISTARTHISEVCRGKRKTFSGYKWECIE